MEGDGAAGNSLFDQPWWLDAAAPGGWAEVTVGEGSSLEARFPYAIRRRLGFTMVSQPVLTPTLGPWVRHPEDGRKRLSTDKRLLGELIEGLPRFDVFQQAFSPAVTNWLPFYWAGFEATVRYTYRIPDLSDPDRVWSAFASATRRQVQKGGKQLEVTTEPDLPQLMDLVERTFRRQGMAAPHGIDVLRRVDAACAEREARRCFFVRDAEGRVHAGMYLVFDERSAYTLIYGRDDEVATSAATPLLHWHAIQFAATVTRSYDFVGSMIEPIERFIRGFGAEQVPYFYVTRVRDRFRPLWEARRRLPRRPRGARSKSPA